MSPAALLVLALLAWSGPARAACQGPSSASDLMRALNEAQSAYASLDTDGFDRASAAVDEALPCLGEPISPPLAAAVHRNEAIKAYIADDPARVRSAFRAALALQPGWRMPEDVLPPGSPLAQLYDEARGLGPGPDEAINLPSGLQLLVDGASAQRVPSERPTVMQIVAPDGQISGTWYLRVGDPFPSELRLLPAPAPVAPPLGPTVAQLPETPPAEAPDRRWLPLAISAGASGLLAGGSYLLSAHAHADYVAPDAVAYEDLAGLERANHVEVIAAGGLGVAALGLGLGALIVGAW